MRDYTYADYFNDSSVEKQLKVTWDSGELTNDDLYAEDFTLTESLNSGTQLDFGSCESASIEFTSFNAEVDLTGEEITISITPVVDGEEVDEAYIVGVYTVSEDTLSGDRSERKIKAYDVMYDIINADVMEWYQDLDFPMTLREFRDAFFEYMEVEQEEIDLVNDDMKITQTVLGSSLTGKDVVHAICEINGCFGTIKQGVFNYVFLPKCSEETADLTISKENYANCEYSDYEIAQIEGLKIVGNTTTEEGEEGDEYYVIVTTGNNMYVIEENFLLYDKTDSELITYGERMHEIINGIYGIRPTEITTLVGNPCVELGDALTIEIGSSRYDYINTCVLERKLEGIQALTDTYKADGDEKFTWDSGSTSSELKRLWGQTQTLIKSVKDKGILVITGTNENDMTISTGESTIVELEVYTQTDAIPIFISTIPLYSDLDGEAIFTTYIDSVEHIQVVGQVHKGNNFLTLTDNFTIEKDETKEFRLTLKMGYYESDNRVAQAQINNLIDFATGGTYSSDLNIDTTVPTVTIADSAIIAEIFLQGGEASDIWNGKITASDKLPSGIVYGNNYIAPTNLAGTVNASVISTDTSSINDTVSIVSYANNYTVATLISTMQENITVERGYTGLWGAWVTEAWQSASGWTWKDMGDASSYIVDVLNGEESEE